MDSESVIPNLVMAPVYVAVIYWVVRPLISLTVDMVRHNLGMPPRPPKGKT